MLTGTVTSFDEGAGLGTVTADTGESWPFHCVSLVDGSRSIATGVRVSFEIGFRVTRSEATLITRI